MQVQRLLFKEHEKRDKAVRVKETGSANHCSQCIDQSYCPINSPVEQSKIFAEHLLAASACSPSRIFAERLVAALAWSPKEVCPKLLDYMPEVMVTAQTKDCSN